MNWFNKGVIFANKASEYIKKHGDEVDMCEHVGEDHSKAAYWASENDSFGVVGRFVFCTECWLAEEEREGNEEVVCHDCRQVRLKKDTFEWKWYDFYALQGDEPLCICNTCKEADTHQRRVKNDEDNRRQEMGDDDWNEDY